MGNSGYTPYGGNGANSGGGSASLVPVTGMYFLHPDHLGSITMITDGHGNIVTDNTGKSHISYTPYGSIHRTDSSGPDISKFKFTGQEEDKESSLLYYKARYYDPVIGRFLQADSIIMPESTFGMNRYMYVEGSPINYRDPDGHKLTTSQAWTIVGYMHGKKQGLSDEDSFRYATIGAEIGKKENMREKKERSFANKAIEVGKMLVSPGYRLYKALKALPSADEIKERLFGRKYFDSREGKINKGIAKGFYYCALIAYNQKNYQTFESCGMIANYLQKYNNHRQRKSDNWNFGYKGTTFKINYENIIYCAILLQQMEEWTKLRRDPNDPNPTNTSNGEEYDPPNRLKMVAQ